MADRFDRRDDDVAPTTGARSATAADAGATRVDEREHLRHDEHLRDDDHLHGRGVDRGTMAGIRERQRDEFGGIAWGSAFFGWLTAVGLSVILVGILSAVGASLALTEGSQIGGQESQETIGLASAIALLAVIAISYFCGGYVAGRMARFDGARQGIGVFAWAIIITALLALAAVIGDSEWNVFGRVDLPRLPVDEGDLTTGGIIALAAVLLTMLVSAIFGGKVGERFHRKVDRHAIDR
jgi:hypothetical protein